MNFIQRSTIKSVQPTFARLFLSLTAVLILVLTPICTMAQNEGEAAPGVTKMFSSDSPIAVTINAPWNSIVKDKKNQDAYPATIEWTDESGQGQSLAITVERRGLTRQVVCEFPPIKLRFEKTSVAGTIFEGQKSLKMVTHCDRTDRNVQYYIKEMLAYQMFNQITDLSFRVRRLEATYVDSEKGKSNGPLFAFLIEDDKHVAKRNGQKKLKIGSAKVKQLDPTHTSNFMVFQYMIGNLDWSALSGPEKDSCCHNGKLIGLDPETDPVYAVPYDFDASGIVDAHYAVVQERLRMRNIKQRLFRGFCAHNDHVPAAVELFVSKKADIMAVIENEPQLEKYPRKGTISYIEQFYKVVSKPDKFKKEVEKACRG